MRRKSVVRGHSLRELALFHGAAVNLEAVNLLRNRFDSVAASVPDSENPRLGRGVSLGQTDLRHKFTARSEMPRSTSEPSLNPKIEL